MPRDNAFRKLPPTQRKLMRDEHVRPLIDSFFLWVKEARASADGRNLATRAIGYAINQEAELRRVLDDGKLPLDNTRSERSLRKIVVGRNYAESRIMRRSMGGARAWTDILP